MARNYKEKFKDLIDKIKSVKNIEIIVAVVLIAALILGYSLITTDKKKVQTQKTIEQNQEMSLTDEVEKKLADVLSKIDGAGKVEIMVTYKGSTEKVIANTKSTHSNSSNGSGSINTSTSTITETPIVISSNGSSRLYVLKEIMPEVTGAIVVAEGASNARVRLELMRAVQTILDINANSIEIFAMK